MNAKIAIIERNILLKMSVMEANKRNESRTIEWLKPKQSDCVLAGVEDRDILGKFTNSV